MYSRVKLNLNKFTASSLPNRAKELILDILFPPLCLSCQKYLNGQDKIVCQDCLRSIKINNTLFCPVCRARLADNKKICHYDSRYILAAAGNYDDAALKNLIQCFKYDYFESLTPILGEILIKYIEKLQLINQLTNQLINYVVVPVPLHLQRQRERGFNQSKLLAEFIAKKFGLQVTDALKRIKNNKPQAKCRDRKDRIKNIEGCFAIKNPEKIQERNLLLIDDVFTSGATMNEAVNVLRKNGVGRIIALVVAKA